VSINQFDEVQCGHYNVKRHNHESLMKAFNFMFTQMSIQHVEGENLMTKQID
jgi:hypothetical protein